MKGQTKTGWKAITLLLASAAFGFAQVNSLSAPARPLQGQYNGNYETPAPAAQVGPGTLNYVEGQVSLDGQNLTSRSVGSATLQPGQPIETGDGYVEILLTPGAFLRLGNNSQLRMVSAGLANTQVQLVRGSAMLEVDQFIKGADLKLEMDNAVTRIQKKGLYNFATDGGAIRVLDGKATVTENSRSKTLGKHDEILIASSHPLKKRNFDENTVKGEPLYVWSKARSEDESQASLRAATNADLYTSAGPGWYWDPYFDSYGFWPMADALYSPFGWGFYSPAYFGFYGGYYPGAYYGGPGWYRNPGWYRDRDGDHDGWRGRFNGRNAPVAGVRGGLQSRGFRSSGASGFHGGFHGGGMGSAFHGFGGGGSHAGGFGGGGFGGGHR